MTAGPQALEAVDKLIAVCRPRAHDGGQLPVLLHRLRHGRVRSRVHDPEGSVSLAHLRQLDSFYGSIHRLHHNREREE